MMTCFYNMDSVWQILLLITSQLTIFSFVIGIVFLYRRGCSPLRIAGIVSLFIVNTVVYVILQLDSRITGARQSDHLHVPYVMLLLFVLISLTYSGFVLIYETRGKKARFMNTS